MTIIAVINAKGGSGKSTLATHVASYLASSGLQVMLGDVDRQQSSRLWLNLRPPQLPKIHGWSINENNFARPPSGVRHVVLDTPGGFHGFNLMKVTMSADAILIPSGVSIFDRQAAADSLKELRTHPRIVTGKCQICCIGMRIDGRTNNANMVQQWADSLGITHLGTIRLAQTYVKCMEGGYSVFDLPAEKARDYVGEWGKLTQWLDALLAAAPPAPGSALARPQAPLPTRILRHATEDGAVLQRA
jgi:chromosome partitioning protein